MKATQRLAAKIVTDDVKKTKAQNIYIGDPFALGIVIFAIRFVSNVVVYEFVFVGGPQHQLIEMEASTIRKQEQMQIQSEDEIRQLEEQEREVSQLEVRFDFLKI